jgi:catechol 2,3-dioxygenase-like lactoylglutathione lyase family enzyme
VFDHVGIRLVDLAASERFYRTVLSVLGAEPSHAGAELVGWEEWWIGATDREHPVTHGLHVGFRAPSREAVDGDVPLDSPLLQRAVRPAVTAA